MNELRENRIRERLAALRDEILAGAEGRREAAGTVHLDQQKVGRLSRMDAMQMQAMARAESERATLLLRQIEAALGRLEQGDYGYCVKCGEDIAEARLEAAPATPFCQWCAA